MKYFYIIVAIAGLALVLIPSLLLYLGKIEAEQMNNFIFIGTLLWFSGAIPWLGKKRAQN
ncbi:MAG: hypothetical protein E4H10_08700 [Bacteroidia bacterium]|nr:MAG: hypothetical protein E4H10_08700 [Bacteroidia bacterium]